MDTASGESGVWSKARIEALTDGVFAIAMTLLVLELKVPHFESRNAGSAEVWAAVRAMAPLFLSFGLTFLLTSAFWVWHHFSFVSIREVDGRIAVINLVFLMFVSLLPFSTAMLGAFSLRQPVSLAFYFGNQLALGLALNVHWLYASRRGLISEPRGPSVRRFSIAIRAQTVACVATLAMIPIAPRWCFRMYALVQLVPMIVLRSRLRAGKRTA